MVTLLCRKGAGTILSGPAALKGSNVSMAKLFYIDILVGIFQLWWFLTDVVLVSDSARCAQVISYLFLISSSVPRLDVCCFE